MTDPKSSLAQQELNKLRQIIDQLSDAISQRLNTPVSPTALAQSHNTMLRLLTQSNLTIDAMVEIPIQINGKNRSKIVVPRGTPREQMLDQAQADPRIAELIEGKEIKKGIAVPDRLVNLVVG